MQNHIATLIVIAMFLGQVGCDKHKPTETISGQNSENRQSSRSSNSKHTLSPLAPTINPLDLARQNLNSISREQQYAAVDMLVKNGSSQAVEILAAFIATLPDGDFKEEVVRRSSLVANHESMPTVLGLITSTHDPGVLRVTQEIFAHSADYESLQAVLNAYDSSTDPNVHDRLEKSVASISTEAAIPALVQIVTDSNTFVVDGMVRSAAQALRQIGTGPAVDAIIARINAEESEDTRALLAAELGRVTNPLAEMNLQTAANGGTKSANNPDARVAAIWALLHHPSAETREALKLLQNDADVQVSFAATEASKTIENRLAAP